MNTAFIINGGIGRQFCSIPALEIYEKENPEDDFVILVLTPDMFYGHPTLYKRVFSESHKDVWNILKDKNIITPEPYHLNDYINQRCNIAQAFDKIINKREEINTGLSLSKLYLDKPERIEAENVLKEYTIDSSKPVLVFQPFGSGIMDTQSGPIDTSSRSMEPNDVLEIMSKFSSAFNIIPMADIPISGYKTPKINIRVWYSIIESANFFLGCDSVGQHFAEATKTNGVVVFGATFPENVSYVNSPNLQMYDFGKDRRQYSPIRIVNTRDVDRNNVDCMKITNFDIENIFNISIRNCTR